MSILPPREAFHEGQLRPKMLEVMKLDEDARKILGRVMNFTDHLFEIVQYLSMVKNYGLNPNDCLPYRKGINKILSEQKVRQSLSSFRKALKEERKRSLGDDY